MKVSVIIATYNGAEFLEEQLDSIREQTRKVDEVVICDDCSTDNTVSVANEYIQKFNLSASWKVYSNETNLGYANNFNKATLLSTGDLLFFSDQDDTWNLSKIEKMEKIMSENPGCQVLSTDYNPWYFGEPERRAPAKVLERMPNDGSLQTINLSNTSMYIGAIGCCMCVRRDFYTNIQKYWFDGWAQDDRMWRLSQCFDGCMILHSNLINHRIHANNTSTYGKYHTIERRVKLFEDMLNANKVMVKALSDRLTLNDNSDNEAEANELNSRINMMKKHVKMMELRIDLLKNRRIFNCFKLVKYISLYESKKSFVLEGYMALKG